MGTRGRIRIGHGRRIDSGVTGLSLLLLGYLLVFLATLFHDELALEIVEAGWFPAEKVERLELMLGLVMFLAWGGLSALMLRFVDAVRNEIR